MLKYINPIILLTISNVFMTFAWYGHLRHKNSALWIVILVSWGIAFLEYCFQVPANKIGFIENGGPFTIWQLKVIQEVITLTVFSIFSILLFKNQQFTYNHLLGFICLILAVYFIFKSWKLFSKIVGNLTKYS